jgi:hypothetical protein
MTYGTTLRLDITAHDCWRTVVRAAAKKLSMRARCDPTRREARHCTYRQMLEYRRQGQEIVWIWRL